MAKGKLPLHLVAWVFVFVSASGGLGWSATQALSAQYQANVANAATQVVMQETATVMAERSARTVQIRATLIEPTQVEQIVSNQVFIPAHEVKPSLVETHNAAPIVTIYPTAAATQPEQNSSRLGMTHYTMPSSVTPQPAATDTPAPFDLAPTLTSEPQVTDIPIVVIVLEPTPTYAATATLEPTWTPAPTPRPTDIPKPTDAPQPTAEPTATEGVLVSPLATPTQEATPIP